MTGLSVVAPLIYEAQTAKEPVVWITTGNELFFPQDMGNSGVDVSAIIIVVAPNFVAAAKAAIKLLQSDSFGLIIIDRFEKETLPTSALGRLTKLGQTADAAMVFLTSNAKNKNSLNSLISLRIHPTYQNVGSNQYICNYNIVKDKRNGNSWTKSEVFNGPAGLR